MSGERGHGGNRPPNGASIEAAAKEKAITPQPAFKTTIQNKAKTQINKDRHCSLSYVPALDDDVELLVALKACERM